MDEPTPYIDEDRPTRRRGRPRGARSGDARKQILKAAAAEFGARGYEATSLRAVARRAGVDPALVHHYFADKPDLFAQAIDVPVRPDKVMRSALAGPRDQLGARIVRAVLEAWEQAPVRTAGIAVVRSMMGTGPASRMVKEFFHRELILQIAERLDAPDAELRAELAASQIAGAMMLRYVLAIDPMASASVDDVVARVGPAVQWHLTGFQPGVAEVTRIIDSEVAPGE